MPTVSFKLDREKDAFNNWETSNKSSRLGNFSGYVPEYIRSISKDKEFNECKEEILSYLSKIHNSKIIQLTLESFQKSWSEIENEYFMRLENITKRRFSGNITAYLTTIMKCPYNFKEKWFMVSFFSNIPRAMVIIGHELFHIHFHIYFWDEIEKEIGYSKTDDLKEALTVLLNNEFKDMWLLEDNGYPQHRELRLFIEQQWIKNKDFNVLLENCIAYLKDDKYFYPHPLVTKNL